MAKYSYSYLKEKEKFILKVELILWEFYFYIFLMVQQDDSVPRLTLEAGYQFKCVSVWEQSPSLSFPSFGSHNGVHFTSIFVDVISLFWGEMMIVEIEQDEGPEIKS